MIFTSYHPIYTLDSPRETRGYHRFHLGKTREFAVLWYLYVRHFLGQDEPITIVDQGGSLSLDPLLAEVMEPYDDRAVDEHEQIGSSSVRLHIRRFTTKEGVREGVKRLYQYIYKFCYRNRLDMFFIENDCLVAKDWLTPCRAVDFATNTICAQNHRACDTYINWVSAQRFHVYDEWMSFDNFLDWVKDGWGDYQHHNDWEAMYDVSSVILNERGAYARWCFGRILTFNNECVLHNAENDQIRLSFIEAHPIDHPYYRSFLAKAKEIVYAN